MTNPQVMVTTQVTNHHNMGHKHSAHGHSAGHIARQMVKPSGKCYALKSTITRLAVLCNGPPKPEACENTGINVRSSCSQRGPAGAGIRAQMLAIARTALLMTELPVIPRHIVGSQMTYSNHTLFVFVTHLSHTGWQPCCTNLPLY